MTTRVLVIEDDPAVRALTVLSLREDGHDVVEADDGLEGLRMLTEGPAPDLIVLDLWMPSMNGWEFRVEQKRDPVLGAVPVIVTSADASPEARAIDADRFLAKPYSPEELRAAVSEALKATGRDASQRYAESDIIGAKYRLTRLLAEGGMGAVWLAKNLALDADVALKVIRHDSASPGAAERLVLEARLLARLEHASVVRVFDVGETGRHDPFIVMELLKGPSLADVLDSRGRLPATEAVQLVLPIASALAAAHGKRIVHRDLKPENVVLVADERGIVTPKVVDFGIAKIRDQERLGGPTTGAIVGSPGYMSPEQARGKTDADERADVWSLCVVLYELLAGQQPFGGDNYNAILAAVLEDPPEPVTSYAAGDAELWSIVERGLAKDPDERWPSMLELGRALADWATLRGIETDVTGGSIALHWQRDAMPIPLVRPAEPAARTPTATGRPTALAATPPVRATRAMWWLTLAAVATGAAIFTVPGAREPAMQGLAWSRSGSVAAAAETYTPMAAPRVAPLEAPAPVPALDLTEPAAPEHATVAPSVDASACAARLLPSDTFTAAPPDLASICDEADPRRGASLLRTEIVRARGGGVTGGMREWAVLGWYEMAAFALARGRCCAEAPAQVLPPPIGSCEPMERPLNDLAAATTRAEADVAVLRYTAAVHCTVIAGGSAQTFGGLPEGAAEATFRRMLDRVLPTAP